MKIKNLEIYFDETSRTEYTPVYVEVEKDDGIISIEGTIIATYSSDNTLENIEVEFCNTYNLDDEELEKLENKIIEKYEEEIQSKDT